MAIDGAIAISDGDLAAELRIALVPLIRGYRQHNVGDVTATQLSVMTTLDRWGPLTITELAEREHVTPPLASRVVTALEERGLVSKGVDPNDGRVYRAELTPAGDNWLTDASARRDRWLTERLMRLSVDERAQIAAVIPVLHRLTEL